MRKNRLDHVEHGKDIGSERSLKLRVVYIENALPDMLLSRVIHEDIDMAQGGNGLGNSLDAKLFISHVTVDQLAFSSALLDFLFGFVRVAMLVKVNNSNVCSLFCKCEGYGPADSAVSSGYDRNFCIQLAASLVIIG